VPRGIVQRNLPNICASTVPTGKERRRRATAGLTVIKACLFLSFYHIFIIFSKTGLSQKREAENIFL
jgi:hypothetical protein